MRASRGPAPTPVPPATCRHGRSRTGWGERGASPASCIASARPASPTPPTRRGPAGWPCRTARSRSRCWCHCWGVIQWSSEWRIAFPACSRPCARIRTAQPPSLPPSPMIPFQSACRTWPGPWPHTSARSCPSTRPMIAGSSRTIATRSPPRRVRVPRSSAPSASAAGRAMRGSSSARQTRGSALRSRTDLPPSHPLIQLRPGDFGCRVCATSPLRLPICTTAASRRWTRCWTTTRRAVRDPARDRVGPSC
jgi:hypothetical protein